MDNLSPTAQVLLEEINRVDRSKNQAQFEQLRLKFAELLMSAGEDINMDTAYAVCARLIAPILLMRGGNEAHNAKVILGLALKYATGEQVKETAH